MKLSFKPRKNDTIEDLNRKSLMHLLKSKVTLEEKREWVRERNELLFIFGDKLSVFNQAYQSYEDFINHQYLGEVK